MNSTDHHNQNLLNTSNLSSINILIFLVKLIIDFDITLVVAIIN